MDELKLKLTTRFMRNMASKWLMRKIRKQYGYKVDIHLNELDINIIDGDTSIKANVEIRMDGLEFEKIMKNIGMD